MQARSLSRSADPAREAGRNLPGAAPQPVLEIEGLVQRFGARTVLELAEWSVGAGRHSLVLGPSGSGKSTLLHLVAGLLRPTRGRIRVAGRDLAEAKRPGELDRWRGRTVGIVLQRLHLIAALSVRDNLRLARALAGLPEDAARIDQLLTELRLEGLAGARPAPAQPGRGAAGRDRARGGQPAGADPGRRADLGARRRQLHGGASSCSCARPTRPARPW